MKIISQIRRLPSVLLCTGKCGCSGDSRLSRRLSKLSKTPLLLSDLCPMQESNMKTLKIKLTYLRFYFFFRTINILQYPLYSNIVLGFYRRDTGCYRKQYCKTQQVDWISNYIVLKVNAAF